MKEMQQQEAQRILGRSVGRELSVEEVEAVSGAWVFEPDPDMTLPFRLGGQWVYGDMG